MKKIITIIKIVKFFSETNYKKLLELVIDKLYQSSSEKLLHSCRRWKLDFNYILSLRLYNT